MTCLWAVLICLDAGNDNVSVVRYSGVPTIEFKIGTVLDAKHQKIKKLFVVVSGKDENGPYCHPYDIIDVIWIKLVPDNLVM